MKIFLLCLLLLPLCLRSAAQDSHPEMAQALVNFLSKTELCLRSCQNADSTAAAVPELKQLRAEAEKLAQRQQELPEPSEQDAMAVQGLSKDFQQLWLAITRHIARMEKDGLMTEELREILCIAPEEPSTAAPSTTPAKAEAQPQEPQSKVQPR